jgi:hypothetical protein
MWKLRRDGPRVGQVEQRNASEAGDRLMGGWQEWRCGSCQAHRREKSWPAPRDVNSGKGATVPLLGPPRTSGTGSTCGDEACVNLCSDSLAVSGGDAIARSLRGSAVMSVL